VPFNPAARLRGRAVHPAGAVPRPRRVFAPT
jgi:hypothetical protein